MNELLKLCGYREQELESELPRVEKAFNKLGITDEDIVQGKQRLTKYFDTELKGIRKGLRLCVREFVNSVLAREDGKKKVLTGFMAPGFDVIGSAAVSHSKEVFSAHQSWAILLVVGRIFDKMVPVLEAAEKEWLKAGVVAHCANVKAILGPITLGLIPKPDLLVSSGYLCEVAPKTLDLFHELYDIPVFSYDSCLDSDLSTDYDASKRTAVLAAKNMRKLVERIQEIVGFEITDDMIWEVINARTELQTTSLKIRRLVESSDPLPISTINDSVWSCLGTLTLSIDETAEAVDAIHTYYEELQERVDKGLGVVEKGAPRILTYCPGGTNPIPEHYITELGIAIVGSSFGLVVPQPYEEEFKDPYLVMAMGRQRMNINQNLRERAAMMIEACKRLKVDGVLDRYHVGCRALAGDALVLESAIKKELGIPVLLLEWEDFDPRVYNQDDYERRLEVFKEMMTGRSA
ncbi:2-hydroxyacyl-CoA dehydratase [Chloroflexota bacterium]